MSIFTASLRVPQGWDSCVKFTLYSQNLPERLTQCKTPDSGTSTFNISDLHVPRKMSDLFLQKPVPLLERILADLQVFEYSYYSIFSSKQQKGMHTWQVAQDMGWVF